MIEDLLLKRNINHFMKSIKEIKNNSLRFYQLSFRNKQTVQKTAEARLTRGISSPRVINKQQFSISFVKYFRQIACLFLNKLLTLSPIISDKVLLIMAFIAPVQRNGREFSLYRPSASKNSAVLVKTSRSNSTPIRIVAKAGKINPILLIFSQFR